MKHIYIFFAIIISFFWGLQPVIHKYVLDEGISGVSIMLYSAIAYIFCLFILILFQKKKIENDLYYLTTKSILLIVFTSIITVFFTNVIYYYVLKDNESSVISALIYSSPVFTMFVAHLFLNENIDIYGISGIILITFGVILIAFNNSLYKYESLELMD